jgi:hypothetical protein
MAPKKRTAKPGKTRRPTKSAPAAARASSLTASLAAVFQALGARDPKRWARAHAKGGSDELARFVLLRALWLKVVEPGRMLARARRDAETGAAIDRMLTRVDLADLDRLVRVAQEHALSDALSVLDDPADDEQAISWAIYRRDKRGAPSSRLESLMRDLPAAKP